MPAKRTNTLNVFIVSALVIIITIRLPLLPIRNETKSWLGYPQESLLNVTERARRLGYSCSEHEVVTEDGYVLRVFALQGGGECEARGGARGGPPVLLVHGLLQSADAWLDAGRGAALAYLLADACRLVWLANTRGNYYSRAHRSLDPDADPAFWRFSVDEVGRYDLPALLDYALARSRASTLDYVGFSQGAGSFFIMCSERPDYCNKVNLMVALAPATRLYNTKSVMYRTLTQTMQKYEGLLSGLGLHEVFSKGALSQEFVEFFCHVTKYTEELCQTGMNKFNSITVQPRNITSEVTRTLFGHFPAGTSLHNMARYGQAMTSEKFVKFDYGSEKNLELYGTPEPPEYNLTAVSAPVVVIYGKNDALVDTEDVEWTMERLPNLQESMLVKDPLWNHLDVTYSQRIGEAIFPKIKEYLDKYNVA